jgi:uncharacterized protein (DUF4415 family)
MKSNDTGKRFPVTDKDWEELIKQAPDHVDDPECPYDPNDPKAVDAFWKDAVVAHGGGPQAVRQALDERRRRRGQRGPQKEPTKVLTTIRLDADVIEHFKAQGPGWQTRINDVLRKAMGES